MALPYEDRNTSSNGAWAAQAQVFHRRQDAVDVTPPVLSGRRVARGDRSRLQECAGPTGPRERFTRDERDIDGIDKVWGGGGWRGLGGSREAAFERTVNTGSRSSRTAQSSGRAGCARLEKGLNSPSIDLSVDGDLPWMRSGGGET